MQTVQSAFYHLFFNFYYNYLRPKTTGYPAGSDGIKAGSRVLKLQPVVEIAIPLKYLNLLPDAKFSYNIRLNGIPELPDIGKLIDPAGGGVDPDEEYISNKTEFWGEYVLAKKP